MIHILLELKWICLKHQQTGLTRLVTYSVICLKGCSYIDAMIDGNTNQWLSYSSLQLINRR